MEKRFCTQQLQLSVSVQMYVDMTVACIRLGAESSAAARLCVVRDAVSATHMLPPSLAFFFRQRSVSDFPAPPAEALQGEEDLM